MSCPPPRRKPPRQRFVLAAKRLKSQREREGARASPPLCAGGGGKARRPSSREGVARAPGQRLRAPARAQPGCHVASLRRRRRGGAAAGLRVGVLEARTRADLLSFEPRFPLPLPPLHFPAPPSALVKTSVSRPGAEAGYPKPVGALSGSSAPR